MYGIYGGDSILEFAEARLRTFAAMSLATESRMIRNKEDSKMGKVNLDICARLKQSRLQRGYRSARQFALAHNMAVNSYLNHENAKRALSLEVVKRYAEWLDIPYIWLLTGENTMEDSPH